MFAAGVPSAVVRFTGKTIKLAGVAPKLHASAAPIFTSCAMRRHPLAGSGVRYSLLLTKRFPLTKLFGSKITQKPKGRRNLVLDIPWIYVSKLTGRRLFINLAGVPFGLKHYSPDS
jgi:hypothetical protein